MKVQVLESATSRRPAIVNYILLSKPAIVALVIEAAFTGMYIANKAVPDIRLMLWTLIGIGLAAAGSAMLNNYIDSDIDRLMKRTSARPLASDAVNAQDALLGGIVLVCASIIITLIFVNGLTALLTFAAACGYVVLYTLLLKRRTSFANQIGGIAGALPPVIGYTAAKGEMDLPVLMLFAVVAIWQQPHALSLALKYKDDYAAAGIPVVPVACGAAAAKKRILIYTALLIPAAAMLYIFGMAGRLYLSVSAVIGIFYLILAVRSLHSKRPYDRALFLYSLIYITALFAVLVFDIV